MEELEEEIPRIWSFSPFASHTSNRSIGSAKTSVGCDRTCPVWTFWEQSQLPLHLHLAHHVQMPLVHVGGPHQKHRRKELWEPSLSPARLQSHHIAARRLCGRQRCRLPAATPPPRPALFPALLLLLPPEQRRPEVYHLS